MDGTKFLGLLFIMIGIVTILMPLAIKYIKGKRCTVEIEARYRRLNSHIKENGRVYYISVYDYTYNNKTYECEAPGTGHSTITIFINPNKPKEIFYKKSSWRNILISLGIIFIIVGFLIYFNI